MRNKFVADIADFHEKFGLKYEGKPRLLETGLHDFRSKFLLEELREYRRSHALGKEAVDLIDPGECTVQLANSLDALVDLVYVALGTAHLHGFDFEAAWDRVHEANMKKVRAQRAEDSKRGSLFDVVKPADWEPPDHSGLVEDNDHFPQA